MVNTSSRINIHKTHNVLGKYCWTCKAKTAAGVPGWPRGTHSDYFSTSGNVLSTEQNQNSKYIGHNPYSNLTSVVWANGDRAGGAERPQCKDCGRHCGKPVEFSFEWGRDPYSEIYKALLQ